MNVIPKLYAMVDMCQYTPKEDIGDKINRNINLKNAIIIMQTAG